MACLQERRSKVQEKNMLCECEKNWKTFSKNYKSTRVW